MTLLRSSKQKRWPTYKTRVKTGRALLAILASWCLQLVAFTHPVRRCSRFVKTLDTGSQPHLFRSASILGLDECYAGTCGLWELESLSKDVKESEQRALGIEIRTGEVTAAVVALDDTNGVVSPSRASLPSSSNLTIAEFPLALAAAIAQAVSPFGKWKGVIGCSVTRDVLKRLGHFKGDLVLPLLRKAGLSPSFLHVMSPTEAAGYAELATTRSAEVGEGHREEWRQLVLVATLGADWGGVVFNDGHRIRRSGLDSLITPDWAATSDSGAKLPTSADPEWPSYIDLADRYIKEMAELVKPDRVIVLPTGEAALRPQRLPPSDFLPLLEQSDAAGKAQGFTLASYSSDFVESSVVSGAAISAVVELRLVRARLMIRKAVEGASSIERLSPAQLRAVYDALDEDGTGSLSLAELEGGLETIGVTQDAREFFFEGMTFSDFYAWWQERVANARVLSITSHTALKELVQKPMSQVPDTFGPIIIAEITFSFCRACKSFARKYERLAEKYQNVRFVNLVANHNSETLGHLRTLDVNKAPTFLLYRRGSDFRQPEASWSGACVTRCEEEVERALNRKAF